MSLTLLCSVDTFFVSVIVGLLGVNTARRNYLIVASAISDSVATLIGYGLHMLLPLTLCNTAFLILLTTAVLTCTLIIFRVTRWLTSVILLPLIFSIDNIVAALDGDLIVSATVVLITGVLSGAFAWCGFRSVDFFLAHRRSPTNQDLRRRLPLIRREVYSSTEQRSTHLWWHERI
jgi:hypothetical protein